MATPNPIQPIQPVNIPSAAGINYGEGDVRHFSQGDAMSVPGISNPTRQLAERDNMLAEKLNEVIENVNNQEQFVPLPVVRTIVAPSDQTVVMNYRIPEGFESRILNASVSSNPSSPDVELDIYFNAGFGGSTGTNVVSTSSEFTSGVNFYQTGEFIVSLKNKSGITLEMVASILLTLRPLGAQGSLLVGSVIKGDKGDPGQVGPPGPPGTPGSGGVGSPGMVWSGSWTAATAYDVRQVVRYDLNGPGDRISSFYCVQANTAGPSNAPDLRSVDSPSSHPYWTAVAVGGTNGTGPAGPPGPAGSVSVTQVPVTIRFYTAANYVAGVYNADYTTNGLDTAGRFYSASIQETALLGAAGSPQGYGALNAQIQACFKGSVYVDLPSVVGGASLDYTTTYINCLATANGTTPVDFVTQNGSIVKSITVHKDTYGFAVTVLNEAPIPVAIQISGVQNIP